MELPEEIKTDRLILKKLSLDYANDIFQDFTNKIVTFMSPESPKKLQDTLDFLNTFSKKWEDKTDMVFVITIKESGEFIGSGGLHKVNTKFPEFGIWIKESAWGNKYGREAVHALKKWVDENLDYEYLSYPVDRRNIPSRKIPESMGGKVFREYQDKTATGRELNIVEYRIFRDC